MAYKVFNDLTGSNAGLIQYCEQNIFGDTGFGQISGNQSRLQIMTNYMNEAYSRFVMIAARSAGKWNFDDNNFTDYPVATTNLIANQSDYPFLSSMLQIKSIEVMNSGGVWYTVGEVSDQEMANDRISQSQRFLIPSQPWVFKRDANSIFLLPAPNYNQTGGLKVRYVRPPSYFIYSDTTKAPGFADLFHEYLANYAIWKYAFSKGMSIKADFAAVVEQAEKVEIPNFYLTREADTTKNIYPKYRYRR